MNDEITPDSKVVVMSGTGVWDHAQFDAFFGQLLYREPSTRATIRTNGANPNLVAPYGTNPERDAWNAAVDARKAAKKARKAAK